MELRQDERIPSIPRFLLKKAHFDGLALPEFEDLGLARIYRYLELRINVGVTEQTVYWNGRVVQVRESWPDHMLYDVVVFIRLLVEVAFLEAINVGMECQGGLVVSLHVSLQHRIPSS